MNKYKLIYDKPKDGVHHLYGSVTGYPDVVDAELTASAGLYRHNIEMLYTYGILNTEYAGGACTIIDAHDEQYTFETLLSYLTNNKTIAATPVVVEEGPSGTQRGCWRLSVGTNNTIRIWNDSQMGNQYKDVPEADIRIRDTVVRIL